MHCVLRRETGQIDAQIREYEKTRYGEEKEERWRKLKQDVRTHYICSYMFKMVVLLLLISIILIWVYWALSSSTHSEWLISATLPFSGCIIGPMIGYLCYMITPERYEYSHLKDDKLRQELDREATLGVFLVLLGVPF